MYISDKIAKRFLRESFELDAMFAFSLQLFWQKSLFSNTPNVKAQVFSLSRNNEKEIDYKTATVKETRKM